MKKTNSPAILKEKILPRIKKLEEGGFYLEIFYLIAAFLEERLKENIVWRISLLQKTLKTAEIKTLVYLGESLEKKSLGQLVSIYAKYSNQKDLIERLKSFNTFRINVIHKIYENPMDSLEKEAREKEPEFYDLIIEINKDCINVIEEEIKITKK